MNTTQDKGLDVLGGWSSIKYNYVAGKTRIAASFITYDDIPAVVFGLVSNYK